MECKDGLWRPVAFLSKSLNETERNYEIHNKEMLAIVRELEAWRHLLERAQSKCEIWIDYKNLEYFMKVQKLNRRQARWTLYLSQFDFTLKHVLETKMGKADGLSRQSDWKVSIEKNNENQVFIKDNWICSMQEVVIEGPKVDIVEKIKKARSKDKDVVRVVEEMKKAGVKYYKMLGPQQIFILFYFIFWLYNNFLLIFFINNEEACDIEVTWLITWCDIRGLEDGRRVWKMISGHIE